MTIPTFEQWLSWVFTGPEPSWEQLWDEAQGDLALWPLQHMTTLFQAPAFLLVAYSERDVRKGLGRLPTVWHLTELIWDQSLAWQARKACIESMLPLFRDLFAKNPLNDVCFMWWDSLRTFGDNNDERVVEAELGVLKQILDLPSPECQVAALHGLGHLAHSGRLEVIRTYLKRRDLDESRRAYANDALAGKVL